MFFTDLFGFEEPYNVPGTISDDNWSLRLGPDFERDYATSAARGQALNLPAPWPWPSAAAAPNSASPTRS